MHAPTTARRRALLAAASLAVLVSGLAACGSDDADTGGGATTTAASDDERYGSTDGESGGTGEAGTIVAEDFSLTDLTVAPGEEFVLKNDGAATHTATADDGAFDTGEVAGGETSGPSTAPTEPGSYPFHCEIHDSMTATLTVEG